MLQDEVPSDRRDSSLRRTVATLASGLASVLLISGLLVSPMARDSQGSRRTAGDAATHRGRIDPEMWPPESDEFTYGLGIVDGNFRDVPTARTIKYRGGGAWIRLTLAQEKDHCGI